MHNNDIFQFEKDISRISTYCISIFLLTICIFIIPISVSAGFYGKSVYDVNNMWQHRNSCYVENFSVNSRQSMSCSRGCTYKIYYYSELVINYTTIENLSIVTSVKLSEHLTHLQAQQEGYSIINSNPKNQIIDCYYVKNNPNIAIVNSPKHNNDAFIALLFFICITLFNIIIFVFCSIIACYCDNHIKNHVKVNMVNNDIELANLKLNR